MHIPTTASPHLVLVQAVSVCIALNIVVLCLWTSPTIPTLNTADAAGINLYDGLNLLFVLAFALEALLKIAGYTFKEYIRDNRFDFFLVVASILGLAIVGFAGPDAQDQPHMRLLRCFRALRIFRLSHVSPSLLKMMRTIAFATPAVCNIMLVLCVFIFFYAQVGMSFLGTLVYDPYGSGFNRYANFETFTRAFHALWRMATGDAWSAQFADAYWNPHVPGVEAPPLAAVTVYFLLYMMFMGWVLISIFVAIVLDYFHDAGSDDGLQIAFEDVEEFQRKWLEFDVTNSAYINTIDLGLLLYACNPPLVAVKKRAASRDNIFAGNVFGAAGQWVRPKLSQLPAVLRDLDVPDHDGKLHFLEVCLALIQRATGIVSEEDLMAQLLRQHPKYLPSLTRLARITGSTSDPTISKEIIAKLREGLEATGLAEEAEAEQFAAGLDPAQKAPPSGVLGLLKRVMAVKPLEEEETPPQSPRAAGPAGKAGRQLAVWKADSLDTPAPLSSPTKRRRASLANWSKGTPEQNLLQLKLREDELEC